MDIFILVILRMFLKNEVDTSDLVNLTTYLCFLKGRVRLSEVYKCPAGLGNSIVKGHKLG